MSITRKAVAAKIEEHLHHQLPLAGLVDWAENAMMAGEFADADIATLSSVVSRLGLLDVKAFGLSWEDCEHLLRRLGYTARVSVVAA